jgi:hypothetical protein
MAKPTVSIITPANNAYTSTNPLNFTSNPLGTPCHGTMSSDVTSAYYQINGGAQVSITPHTNWSLPRLTTGDCPNTNTTYTLKVTVDNGTDTNNDSSTFYRGT